MISILLSVALLCATDASVAAEGFKSDVEAWNEGVEAYRAGDITNALRVLRPLMLSKTHGPRAAEVVACIAHSRGDLEEAADAAQIALRSAPDDAKANRNFTRAIDGLPAMRNAKRVEKLIKESNGKDPGSMMQAALGDARELMLAAASFRTNPPMRAVSLADSLSRRASALADVWVPVREMIANSVTNEEQAATITLQIEAAEAKTKKAAEEFSDLSEQAYSTMSDVEHDCTRFFKATAMPPAAIHEGEIAQSNAWQDVEVFNGRSWQNEALDYTRVFRAKFPAWARAYEQQAQSDTNKPPFTAEDQAKIAELATQLEKLQLECVEKFLPPEQERALGIIRQIRELLPKDNSGGSGQSGQSQNKSDSNQNQNQNQQNEDQKKPDEGESNQNEKQTDQEENPPEPENGEASEEDENTPEDQEVEATLRKAQERNDEHEADKKARMRKAPLPPNERDW